MRGGKGKWVEGKAVCKEKKIDKTIYINYITFRTSENDEETIKTICFLFKECFCFLSTI